MYTYIYELWEDMHVQNNYIYKLETTDFELLLLLNHCVLKIKCIY